MIGQVLEATVQNFAFGLVIGCLIALAAVLIAERANARREREANLLEIDRRGHERGRRL